MEIADHCRQIAEEFKRGRVIPFLGAGVNLCGFPRTPDDVEYWRKQGWLPSGVELSKHLAQRFFYNDAETDWDLMRVSQFASVMEGNGPLYEELQQLFSRAYPATALHTLLAKIPALLREKGSDVGLPLIITTNYDEVLETAFDAAGEPFDIVCYFVERDEQRGKFWHLPDASGHFRKADGKPGDSGTVLESAPWVLIEAPNTYTGLPVRKRTIILKIHGAVDRTSVEHSSFVITEDDYIDYLARMDFSNPLPKKLQELMKYARYLFLGYGLRDWNLRVVLQRIWGEQRLTYQSWAIQLNPQEIDRKSWASRKVDILDIKLEDYVPILEEAITKADALPAAEAKP